MIKKREDRKRKKEVNVKGGKKRTENKRKEWRNIDE